jgi:transposase
MPNNSHSPLTAINNHNGVISNETRLILAIDRITSLPLLYRYNAGNIVDVTTLKSTIQELTAYGVSVDFSILDAGYYSEKNIKALYAAEIRFVTRLSTNRKLYKELVKNHAGALQSQDNAVFYRERLLYIKRVPIHLCGKDAYAYVAIDHQRRSDEIYTFMKHTAEDKHIDLSADKLDYQLKSKGVFIILSSENVETSEILPLYYTRQAIEQVFDLYKNNADLLPLRTHSEDTFRGHLMLSFLATIAYMLVNRLLDGSRFCANGAFRVLHNLKCKVFDDYILVKEAPKRVNDIAKCLKIELPLKL